MPAWGDQHCIGLMDTYMTRAPGGDRGVGLVRYVRRGCPDRRPDRPRCCGRRCVLAPEHTQDFGVVVDNFSFNILVARVGVLGRWMSECDSGVMDE